MAIVRQSPNRISILAGTSVGRTHGVASEPRRQSVLCVVGRQQWMTVTAFPPPSRTAGSTGASSQPVGVCIDTGGGVHDVVHIARGQPTCSQRCAGSPDRAARGPSAWSPQSPTPLIELAGPIARRTLRTRSCCAIEPTARKLSLTSLVRGTPQHLDRLHGRREQLHLVHVDLLLRRSSAFSATHSETVAHRWRCRRRVGVAAVVEQTRHTHRAGVPGGKVDDADAGLGQHCRLGHEGLQDGRGGRSPAEAREWLAIASCAI